MIITSLCNSAHLPYKFDFIRNRDVRKTDLGNRIYAEGDTRLECIEECSIEELSDDCAEKGGNCVSEEMVDVCDVVVGTSSVDGELEEGGRDVEGEGELEGRDVEDDRGKGVGRHVPVDGPPPSLMNLTSPI